MNTTEKASCGQQPTCTEGEGSQGTYPADTQELCRAISKTQLLAGNQKYSPWRKKYGVPQKEKTKAQGQCLWPVGYTDPGLLRSKPS